MLALVGTAMLRLVMFWVEDVRPSSMTRPRICWKIKYRSRGDTAEIMPVRPRPPITTGQRPGCSIVEPHRHGVVESAGVAALHGCTNTEQAGAAPGMIVDNYIVSGGSASRHARVGP